MTIFKENKNQFISNMQTLKADLHSFMSMGIGRGDNASHIKKKALLKNLKAGIEEIDTNEHGIRVVLIKTKE